LPLTANIFLEFGPNAADNGFWGRINDLADDAGIAPFTQSEVQAIKTNIQSAIEDVFGNFDIHVALTNPGGAFTTINFNASGSNNLLGLAGLSPTEANALDTLNRHQSQTVQVFTSNFTALNHIQGNYSPATLRNGQITELSNALSNVATHELAHTFGLPHHFAYFDLSVDEATGNGLADTGGRQNHFMMSSGETGAAVTSLQLGLRPPSLFSTAVLEFGNHINADPADTITESSAAHNTFATAQNLPLQTLPISRLDGFYVEAAKLTTNQHDVYKFSATQGDVLNLAAQSVHTRYSYDPQYVADGREVFTKMTVYSPAQVPLYTFEGVRWTSTTLNGSNFSSLSFDSAGANLPLLAGSGTYYIKVQPGSLKPTDTGVYDLIGAVYTPGEILSGELHVNATGVSDAVSLSQSGNTIQVSVGQIQRSFNATSVSRITVNLFGGDDVLNTSASFAKSIVASGGAGNDSITTGAGSDTIFGDDGNDIIFAGSGSDFLSGGAGNDVLVGQGGVDYILAADGEQDAISIDILDVILSKDVNDILF
jgi:Ca2+-binding RTX toxin-like protein